MTGQRFLITVGPGPAGYTVGLYAARADLGPLIIERAQYGGALMDSTRVDNFPGFTDGMLGPELAGRR